jgi:hypothetical protein
MDWDLKAQGKGEKSGKSWVNQNPQLSLWMGARCALTQEKKERGKNMQKTLRTLGGKGRIRTRLSRNSKTRGSGYGE